MADLIKRKVYRAMHRTLKNARAVVFLFDAWPNVTCASFPERSMPRKFIPFRTDTKERLMKPTAENRCIVVYSGTVSTYRYDTLLRSLVCSRTSILRKPSGWRIHFVGEGADAVMNDAASFAVSDLVETTAPFPQSIIAALQRAALAPLLRSDGLYFVGLDFIGNFLTEVNVTQPYGHSRGQCSQPRALKAMCSTSSSGKSKTTTD
jgi:hypothetical protein